MKSIKEVENLNGVKVLVRLDLNVPVENGRIVDDFRIRKSIPLIKYLYDGGANIILVSHIETKDNPTLEPVAKHFNTLGINCYFEKNYKKVLGSSERIILLENLRVNEGEKKNDRQFAKELASLADIYVNEAFSVSHREHASVCAITEYIPSYIGFQFEEEIKHLSLAFRPDHPFLFILGGAKFETKIPLVDRFIDSVDTMFVGGALANDFLREKGVDIGDSLVSENRMDLSKYLNNEKILLPRDTVLKGTAIMDVGEKTVEILQEEINKAKFVLWNGPLGAYELGYRGPTLEVSRMLAEATKRGVKTIVGGGDTLAAIAELQLEDSFTFVSTGGGAMLDYLAKGTLPGIEAMSKSVL